jgi:membrane protein DedA with SNARE-associated domain
MLHEAVQWIVGVVGQWGYTGIVVMMTLESSFFPFPSEVVMIPAGYLAFQGKMNLFLAIFWGVVGSWLGALVNYGLAVYLGRPVLLRWGRYFFIKEKDFLRVEQFFRRHGEIGTFTGRLIPVVRQYISFPAGLARMRMSHFLFYTGLGAGLWVTVLALIGYVAGRNEDLIRRYTHQATLGALALCTIVIVVYIAAYRRRRARRTEPSV